DNLDADFGEGGLFDDGEIGKNNSVSFEDSCLSYRRQMASLSTLCKAAPLKITIELTDETAFLFLKLKKKFEKEMGANGRFLNNKEVIGEILKRLADAEFSEKVSEKVVAENDEKHAAEKVILEDNFCKGEVRGEKIGGNKKTILEDNFCKGKFADEEKENKTEILESGSMDKPIEQKNESEKYRQKISRYIPVHVKKMAILRARGKCAYPNCGHPAEIFHHRERFAESKKRLERGMNEGDKMRPDDADKRLKQAVHESVVPFCRTHHEFAHNGIIANESQNSEQWTLEIGQANFSRADVLYREIRQENIKN
ncbi:MAG: hypothetical protein Q8P62_05135, partial [Candidatus Peregrinibacteria bacterium]|nr:hypothetical protein [Candidatus Peregrinibacteria bacterium]